MKYQEQRHPVHALDEQTLAVIKEQLSQANQDYLMLNSALQADPNNAKIKFLLSRVNTLRNDLKNDLDSREITDETPAAEPVYYFFGA